MWKCRNRESCLRTIDTVGTPLRVKSNVDRSYIWVKYAQSIAAIRPTFFRVRTCASKGKQCGEQLAKRTTGVLVSFRGIVFTSPTRIRQRVRIRQLDNDETETAVSFSNIQYAIHTTRCIIQRSCDLANRRNSQVRFSKEPPCPR